MRRASFRRHGSFRGGIDLPEETHRTLHAPIRPAPPLECLRISLVPGGRSPAELIVSPGSRVSAGQCIARASDETGVDIFAPCSARLGETTTCPAADRDGFVEQAVVELTELPESQQIRTLTPVFDWRAATREELLARLLQGQLVTFTRRVQPLAQWVRRAMDRRCSTLLCNGMEHEPYVTSTHSLLKYHGPEIARGLAILAGAMGIDDVSLAVDARYQDDYQDIVAPTQTYGIEGYSLPSKYPISAENVLIMVLTGREVPVNGSPMDLSVAVVDPATCFAVYRWVACDQRCTHRVVTVSGPRIDDPGNYWVPFGADCHELLGNGEQPLIHGGPMVGKRIVDRSVVNASTDALLAIDAPIPHVPTPCIRCGWCTDHCPARLNVAALNDAFELGDVAYADRAGAMACVECGLCSYVCPARLALSQRVRRLKRNLFFLRHRAAMDKGGK
ncbi:MAG: 4Fe-4S dicluster domain-containing protein [Phycisphaerae bacterium]